MVCLSRLGYQYILTQVWYWTTILLCIVKDKNFNETRGGDVLLAIKNKYQYYPVNVSNVNENIQSMDFAGVKIIFNYVFIINIPPTLLLTLFEELFNFLNEIEEFYHI